MKPEHKLAAKVGVVLGIVLIIVVAYYAGALAQFGWSPPQMAQLPSATNPPSGSSSQFANPVGTFWVYDSAYETLSPSSTSASYFTYYALRGGSYIPLGSAGMTGYTQVETTLSDNGVIYAVPTPASNEIFDSAKTAQSNSAIQSITFKDITGDGEPEFVCAVSLNQVEPPVQGYPTLTLVGFWYYNAIDDGVAISHPEDIQASRASQANYVEWSLSCNYPDALAFYKVQVKFDTTSTSDAKVTNVEVPTVGNVAGSAMHYWYDSSYQYFEYTIGTGTLGDCAYMTWQQNAPAKQYVAATITTGLISANVTATYTMFALDFDGSTYAITDNVVFYVLD